MRWGSGVPEGLNCDSACCDGMWGHFFPEKKPYFSEILQQKKINIYLEIFRKDIFILNTSKTINRNQLVGMGEEEMRWLMQGD